MPGGLTLGHLSPAAPAGSVLRAEAPGQPEAEEPTMHDTSIKPFYFDGARLRALAEDRAGEYAAAQPFPHVVVDDLLPEWVIDGVLEEFPTAEGARWTAYRGATEVKLELTEGAELGVFTRHVLAQFNSAEFTNFLELLSGINGLVPDPHLVGGGLHQIERGGYLAVHADFSEHPRLLLDRRLNVLVYLNKDWREEYGGHLELWDRSMSRAQQRVLPIANRCVVFSTTSYSYHGHPDPLTCPEGWTRKSMAFYYYTHGRPSDEICSTAHSTLFKARPANRSERLRVVAQRYAPPVLSDAYRSLARRRQERRAR